MATKITRNGATQRFYAFETFDGASDSVQTSASVGYSDSFTGGQLPTWRRHVAHGNNATTDASGLRETYSVGHGSASVTWKQKGIHQPLTAFITPGQWDGSGCMSLSNIFRAGSPDGFGEFEAIADTQARIRFLQQYRQARTTFNGGTFLGELAETVHQIRHPAQKLREGLVDYYHDVKKRLNGVRRNSKKQSRIVAESWLEYSFGVKPLVMDIYDAVALLRARPDSAWSPIRGFANTPCTYSFSVSTLSPPAITGLAAAPISWSYNRQTKGVSSVRYIGAVRCSVPVPSFVEQVGLSWSNVLPTAWELIPYSFLVDYFTNIGNIIDSMSLGTIGLAWGCRTVRTTLTLSGVVARAIPGTNANTQVSSCHAYSSVTKSTRTSFSRTPVSSVSVGLNDFQFRVPGISSTKWLNVGALARLRYR